MISVLYLEDSDLDAELVGARLAKAAVPLALDRVADGDAFVGRLRATAYDLILSDYQLPGFDGETALRHAQELRPDVPFIFVSGILGEELAVEMLKLGATDYVLKSGLQRLIPAVERALAEARDRAEKRAVEEELRHSRATLAFALEAGELGQWELDTATGRSTRSPLHDRIFGYAEPVPEWTYDRFLEHVDPADRAAVNTGFRASVAAGGPVEFEARIRRADGAVRWVWASGRPQPDAPARYTGVIRDVTDRRLAEEALREADRRKDEFLATLAHELRNPLAPIRTGLQVLRVNADPQVVARTRAMMDRQLTHLVRLVDDLLDVSRITRGAIVLKREPLDLRKVVETAVEASRPVVEAGRHTLQVKLPADPLPVVGDPTRLAQVVSNLLNNSARYTPDGGVVT
ncbi:MAG TPA: histidine kinase dimerization/phospho-acceptor domain-containing protein, partial [Gemmataceae bacterium]|nr:histidine kinase dimerization/phospho-acceptor domain-containing protein [Gemmataceae bacterium]